MRRTQVACAGRRIVAGALILVFAGVATARADVTIKRHSTFKGLGGMMNTDVTSVESIAGDKSANESETRMTNKVVKFLAGGKAQKTTSVIRLDKGLLWDINHQEKSYTEMTLAEMRAMMDSLGQMFGAGMQGGEQKPAIDTTKMTFSPPTFDIKKTGQTAVIAGQSCNESILTMTTKGTDKKSGDTMRMVVTMEMMLAQNVPGAAEQEQFGRKMAEALGVSMDRGAAQSMAGMLKAYGIDPKTLAAEAEKMKGFAMRTVMRFRMESAAQTQATTQTPPSGQAQSGETAGTQEKETPAGGKETAVKALGGLFGKKNKDKDKKAEASKTQESKPAAAPDNSMLSLTTEVTEISVGAVTADRFELPAGYKKQKNALEKK